jgi:hypothetical protein
MTFLVQLPPEILVNIMSYLPPQDALNMLLTCRGVKEAADHPSVWKKVVLFNSSLSDESVEALATNRADASWKCWACAIALANKSDEQVKAFKQTLRWLPYVLVLQSKQSTLLSCNS